MDFTLIKKILWRLKWYILIIPFICGAITYYLISLKPKQYISKAQLATGITDQEKVTLGDNDNNWNVIGNKFANFLAFMDSKEIISMVSYKLLIHDLTNPKPYRIPDNETLNRYKFTRDEVTKLLPIVRHKYDSLLLLDNNNAVDKRILDLINIYDYDIKSLRKTLSTSRILTSDFIKIEAKTENQYLSAFLVNQFCMEVIRFNSFSESKRFGNSLSFFRDLMLQKKKEMELKLDTLRKFKESSQLVDYAKQSESKLDQIAQLELNRNDELKKISSLKSAIEEIKRKIGAAGSSAGEDVFQNNRVIQLQERIQKMSQRYYANTGNKRLADSIQTLRSELENRIYLMSKTPSGDLEEKSKQELITKKLNYEIELSMAQSNYTIIESLLNNLKYNVTSIVSDEGKIASLELEIKAATDEYISIEEKYNKARNISLISGASLRQIELGQPSDEPESTHIMLFTLISMIAGGLIVAGSGIGLAFLDQSIRTQERLEELTGLKSLGLIHKIGKREINLQQLIEIFSKNEKEKNVLEQQLRSLRYEIIKDKSKVVLFTSLDKGHGKSFTIFSLAYSLSQNGLRVLIIDTNFKNNSLSVLFDNFLFQNFMQKMDEGRLLSAESSTTTAQEGTYPSQVVYPNNDFIKKTGFTNIDFIGSSNSDKSPFEIFNDRDFHRLIATLVQSYDFIFLEGSALNNYSDSKELVEFVDKIALVVSAQYSISKVDRQSIKFLNSMGDRMMGAVLNKVDLGDLK